MITVITPTLNAAGTLERTLRSVEGLGHVCEHIVVDGGSTDGTAEILSGWRNATSAYKRRLIVREPTGIFSAMNAGVAEATGDWLWFLNADDWVHADASEALRRLPAQRSDVYVAGAEVHSGQRSWFWTGCWGRGEFTRLKNPCHQATLVSRSVFLALKGFDLQYRLAADFDFMVRLDSGQASVTQTTLPLCCFSAGGRSWTSSAAEVERVQIIVRNYGAIYGVRAALFGAKVCLLKQIRRNNAAHK